MIRPRNGLLCAIVVASCAAHEPANGGDLVVVAPGYSAGAQRLGEVARVEHTPSSDRALSAFGVSPLGAAGTKEQEVRISLAGCDTYVVRITGEGRAAAGEIYAWTNAWQAGKGDGPDLPTGYRCKVAWAHLASEVDRESLSPIRELQWPVCRVETDKMNWARFLRQLDQEGLWNLHHEEHGTGIPSGLGDVLNIGIAKAGGVRQASYPVLDCSLGQVGACAEAPPEADQVAKVVRAALNEIAVGLTDPDWCR